jgi:hypothetical protein
MFYIQHLACIYKNIARKQISCHTHGRICWINLQEIVPANIKHIVMDIVFICRIINKLIKVRTINYLYLIVNILQILKAQYRQRYRQVWRQRF